MRRFRRLVTPSLLLVLVCCLAAPLLRSSRAAAPATPPATAPTIDLTGPFPSPHNTEPDKTGPMPAADAASQMRLPPGFNATVFAAEPDVQNPIAMTWDARGRLWVAENYTYAERATRFDMGLRDRILIFEDNKGDGHFSSRKVFTDRVQMLTSVEVGTGGVWAMCPPNLIFIPDKDGDDVPDAEPQVILDGFTPPKSNYHNFANGLRFGPDGWLYGRCGHSAPGEIGAPGASPEQRLALRGTMWRYHPQRKVFEALATGATNPWGHDWDEHGELFFINTVNGHLWHAITGAHYLITGGNTHTYGLIDQHADHWHFDTAQHWSKSRAGAADSYGGGHAHIGCMIYQGDNWPAEYRGHLFTFNMHGLRANQETLERAGSGYVGHHGQDFLFAADKWFRGIDLGYGPDGGVFALDWSDAGECHESTGVHRTSGRIFKISYGQPKPGQTADLTTLDPHALVQLHAHPSEWFVRQARRQLADRAAAGVDLATAATELRDTVTNNPDVVRKLRALWSLYVIGAADEPFLRTLLHHDNEHLRVWAIRLLTDAWPLDTRLSLRPTGAVEASTASLLPEFVKLARDDRSGLVRLTLSSTLQRLPIGDRVSIAAELVAHKEDANDHNLPLMIWYGLIPVADHAPAALPKLAAKCEIPVTRKYIARRLAEDIDDDAAPLNELFNLAAVSKSIDLQSDVVAGLAEALKGWRKATKPAAWDAVGAALASSDDPALKERLRELNVVFGDPRALEEMKAVALDDAAATPARVAALEALVAHPPADLRTICEKLVRVRGLGPVAAQGLASFNDPAVADLLVAAYSTFDAKERPQLIAALTSRPASAAKLLDALEKGTIPRNQVTPFHARQIRGFNDDALTHRLTAVWGDLHDTPAEKRQTIVDLKAKFTPAVLAKADKKQGRAQFAALCAVCHTLYGEGGKVGPDLTGAGRDNLDYLLENIVDPSAIVAADFRMSIVKTRDGRELNGIVTAKTDRTVTLRTMTEVTTLERAEITSMKESTQSLMPEGLLEAIGDTASRDLLAYLMDKRPPSK